MTTYSGIDYGLGKSNIHPKTGIRYGVIPHHELGEAWYEGSESYYGKPSCPECGYEFKKSKNPVKCPNCQYRPDDESEFQPEEPISFYLKDGFYTAEQSYDDTDIFILKSIYYTYAQFCSPCAPGAGYLNSPCMESPDKCEELGFPKVYCFGHEMFWAYPNKNKAPYPVYLVSTGELIEPIEDEKELIP